MLILLEFTLILWLTSKLHNKYYKTTKILAIKKDYILDKATVNTRFVLLCLGALGTAAATARCKIYFILVLKLIAHSLKLLEMPL